MHRKLNQSAGGKFFLQETPEKFGSPMGIWSSGRHRRPPDQPIFCRPEDFPSLRSAKIGFKSLDFTD